MRIRWIGHACFPIEPENGRIVTDPFAADVPVEALLETMDNACHIGSSDVVPTRASLSETVEVWV